MNDDLISRQAAIAALMNSELGSWNNDDYERGARAQHLDDVAAIKSVPSVRKKRKPSAQPDYDLSGYSDRLWKAAYERGKAEPEPRWIPVTEQTLPRENSTVVAIGKTATWDVGNYRGHVESNIHMWYWKKNTIKDVYWWMYKKDALPKPYERSEE